MTGSLFHIKVNGNETNKDNGFYALMVSGSSVVCLKDEEYIIDSNAKEKLDTEEIDYDKVENQKVVSDKSKQGEEDATKAKI